MWYLIVSIPDLCTLSYLYEKKNMKKYFLSETIRPRVLIFGKHDLVDIYPVCSNYAPEAKIGPTPGVTRDMASFQQIPIC